MCCGQLYSTSAWPGATGTLGCLCSLLVSTLLLPVMQESWRNKSCQDSMQTTKHNTAKVFGEWKVPLLLPARVGKQMLVGLSLGSFWNPPILSSILSVILLQRNCLCSLISVYWGLEKCLTCTVTPAGKILRGRTEQEGAFRTGGEGWYRYLYKFLAVFAIQALFCLKLFNFSPNIV